MLFFRSEDAIRQWCATRQSPVRPIVRMDQLWILASTWYATRLQETACRPGPDDVRRIFAGLGLRESFWDPAAGRAG